LRKSWSKTEVRQLRSGDVRMLRRWFFAYADCLYTWIVRHSGLPQEEAQEKTAHLLQTAYSKIEKYEPSAGSMYSWLLGEAAALTVPAFSPENLRNGPKAAEVLYSLARIGTNDFPEEYLENPLTVHLIQAVLAELDEPYRRLLLSRYYRIETEEMSSVFFESLPEGNEEDLAQARYYFRRFLSAWLKKLQTAPAEMPAEFRLDLFERNLEKILRSIPPFLQLPLEKRRTMEEMLLHQAELRSSSIRAERIQLRKHLLRPVGVVLCLGIAVLVYFLLKLIPSEEKTAVSIHPAPVSSRRLEPQEKKESAEDLKETLNQVFAAGSVGDVPELLRILQSGPYPAQVAAAVFLGRFGDASAIGPLERASRRWFPSSTDEDPFLLAIEQIEQRLRGIVPAQEMEIEYVSLEPNRGPGETEAASQEQTKPEMMPDAQKKEEQEVSIPKETAVKEPETAEPNGLSEEQKEEIPAEGEQDILSQESQTENDGLDENQTGEIQNDLSGGPTGF